MIIVIRGGERYVVNELGQISRDGGKTFFKQWTIEGAVELNNFGHVVRRYTRDDVLTSPDSIAWKFKNGKQRTFMRDRDNGTLREWASPSHYAFKSN